MIRTHAAKFLNEEAALRQLIVPIFNPTLDEAEPAQRKIANDAGLVEAVQELIVLAKTNHEVIRSAFTLPSESGTVSAIRSPQFWGL